MQSCNLELCNSTNEIISVPPRPTAKYHASRSLAMASLSSRRRLSSTLPTKHTPIHKQSNKQLLHITITPCLLIIQLIRHHIFINQYKIINHLSVTSPSQFLGSQLGFCLFFLHLSSILLRLLRFQLLPLLGSDRLLRRFLLGQTLLSQSWMMPLDIFSKERKWGEKTPTFEARVIGHFKPPWPRLLLCPPLRISRSFPGTQPMFLWSLKVFRYFYLNSTLWKTQQRNNALPFCFRRNPKILDFLDNHTPAKKKQGKSVAISKALFCALQGLLGLPGLPRMHHLGWPTKNSGIEIRIPKQNNLSGSRVTNIYSVQMSRLSPLDYFPAKHASTYTAKTGQGANSLVAWDIWRRTLEDRLNHWSTSARSLETVSWSRCFEVTRISNLSTCLHSYLKRNL